MAISDKLESVEDAVSEHKVEIALVSQRLDSLTKSIDSANEKMFEKLEAISNKVDDVSKLVALHEYKFNSSNETKNSLSSWALGLITVVATLLAAWLSK